MAKQVDGFVRNVTDELYWIWRATEKVTLPAVAMGGPTETRPALVQKRPARSACSSAVNLGRLALTREILPARNIAEVRF